ncbi:MAG TPA: nitrilase-related carbon-nitrogen hydrolase, partial [Kiritimatiellia bacterium]
MKTKIALVQMSCSDSTDENLNKAVARVEEAASRGAQIVCLPELFRSRYFCQKEDSSFFDLAEPVPGPSTKALGQAAQKHGVVIVA